ncbi:MAG: serine/threonine-protein kinase [Kiritimatiellia bacterium]
MRIPGFDIHDKIGEGATAAVWKAYQVSLGRMTAVKILKPECAAKPEEVKDFIAEARSAARLKHPNIVQVYDVGNQDGTHYFVMEYVDGPTVSQMLSRQSRLSAKKALKIAKDVADALHRAWEDVGIIHRDIKPDNIMLDKDGTVKLADLGLAKIVKHAKTTGEEPRRLEGTPNYMSPEQAGCDTDLDVTSDMYSMGATLYHMVTGKLPFGDSSPDRVVDLQIEGHLVNPREIEPSISIGLAQLITNLMMKKKEDRYSDWQEAIADFRKVSAGRILLAGHGSGADSTISPVSGKSTTKSTTKTRKQAVGSKRSSDDASPSKRVPGVVQFTAWSLMVLWWIVLAYKLLG